MTTKEYFKSLGFSDEDVEHIVRKISLKDVAIIEDRIRGYKEELGIKQEELLKMIAKYPSLLNIKASSENHKSANERLEEYAKVLGLSIDEAKTLIRRCPSLLGRKTIKPAENDQLEDTLEDDSTIRHRIMLYAKLLNTDEKTVSRMIKKVPVLLNLDITEDENCSIARKFKDLTEIFNCSEEEISKIIITFPSILTHSTTEDEIDNQENNEENKASTSIPSKLREYSKLFGLTQKEVIKMIRKCPNLIGFDVYSENPGSVKGKIKDYKELLNVTDEELKKIIKSQPASLTYDTSTELTTKDNDENTSVLFKLHKYAELLNTDIPTIQKMIKQTPTLLGLEISQKSKTGVPAKLKSLLSFTTTKDIIDNPILLTFPAKSVKLRYLMLATTLGKDAVESNYNLLIRSEKSMWSRIKFLEDKKCSTGRLIYSNKTFEKIYKITSEELEQLYPLTKEDIIELQNKYFRLYGKEFPLDDKEIEQVL